MYLVGLSLQAAVLGGIVGGAILFEEPIRAALDLPAGETAAVASSLERIEDRLAGIEDRLDTLAAAAGDEDVARRLAVVESLVARVEGKVDDVRDAQLFPVSEPALDEVP